MNPARAIGCSARPRTCLRSKWRGHTDANPRSDVFGLGGILCEILTGEPPYVGDDAATVTRQAAAGEQFELLARLAHCGADDQLSVLTRSCLAPDPADRPTDAGAVAQLLGNYLTIRECRDRHVRQNRDRSRLRVAGLLTAAAALGASAIAGATARDLHARGAVRHDSPPTIRAVTPTGSPPADGARMSTFRRFLVIQALILWQGGFLFYAAVVVPTGSKVFSSSDRGSSPGTSPTG